MADVVPAEVDVGMTTASEVRALVRDDVHPSVRLCAGDKIVGEEIGAPELSPGRDSGPTTSTPPRRW